jgi:hypothetical protein
MLKVVTWDDEDAITHDPLRIRGAVITLIPQQPWIQLLGVLEAFT